MAEGDSDGGGTESFGSVGWFSNHGDLPERIRASAPADGVVGDSAELGEHEFPPSPLLHSAEPRRYGDFAEEPSALTPSLCQSGLLDEEGAVGVTELPLQLDPLAGALPIPAPPQSAEPMVDDPSQVGDGRPSEVG